MERLVTDLRYATRVLLKTPAFTAIAVLTLALGIGANTAIFSVVDWVMLRPLPYPDIERIVIINERGGGPTGQGMSVSWPNFQDYRAQNTAFESFGVYRGLTVNLTGGDQPERLNGAIASADMFRATGIAPMQGRTFTADDDKPGAPAIAVISERLWRNRFGADPALVGRDVVLNGETHTIVGVMPAPMRFPSRLTDVWLPLGRIVARLPNSRGVHPGLTVVAKIKPGLSFEQARADMQMVSARLAQQYPDSNKLVDTVLTPYYELVVQNIRPALQVLMGAVAFVLLIACANLANLMLARAEGRQREIAIRGALGAERGRIIQQLLTESVLVAVTGGVMGMLLATWAVRAFVASRPATVPRIDLIGVDGRVLAFAAAISVLTGIVFGSMPAVRASSPQLLMALKEWSHSASGAAARRFRSALIVAEVALAIVLLVGAGLMIKSFGRLMAIETGFDAERVVTMRLTLPDTKYTDVPRWTTFHQELIRRVSAVPGVESVGINSLVPLEGSGSEAGIIKPGDPMPSPDHPAPTALFQTTSPQYFAAMGIQVLRGRAFTDQDTETSPPVAIVDESLAERMFKNVDPIGQRVSFEFTIGHTPAENAAQSNWREIVGVVRHVKHYGLVTEPPFVQIYTPFRQLPTYMRDRRPSMALVVRTATEPEALASTIRREVAAIDRDIPVYGIQTMSNYVAQMTEQPRLSMALLGMFGGLALVLAIVGIYGVLSYSVTQRTREIGIRMALGASRSDVLRQIVGQGMALTLIGVAIGVALSLAATKFLSSMLYGVSPHDPFTFVAIAAVLSTAALAAALLPGRRAASVDPIEALRYE